MTACPNCAAMGMRVQEQEKKVQTLEAENAVLKYDLQQMREKWFSKRRKRDEAPEGSKRPPKKRGAPVGHPGWFRRKPDRVDVTEEVTLTHCPECGFSDLGKCNKVEEHIQEDIVLPALKVTRYRRHLYWCRQCKAVVSGRGKDEVPHSIIGPVAKSLAAFLKFKIHVPQRGVQEIFKRLCGLVIVPSSVPGFHNQIRRKGMSLYEEIKNALTSAPYVHGDETGNPVDGDRRWNWIFATLKLCLHVVRKSRGQKVVEEILGKTYDGILVSDFLSAYNAVNARARQRCLVHLLRELKKVLACAGQEDPVHTYCQQLKELIQKAMDLGAQRGTVPPAEFQQQRNRLNDSLRNFQFPGARGGVIGRLSKRLARHKEELLTFLDHPGLPSHNNHAEQLLRSSVILRKICFGQRSENGVENHNVLMSLQQTAQLNGKDSVPLFREILTSPTPIPLTRILGP